MDIAKEKSVSDLTDRCRGAIWGQFIGDAACAEAQQLDQDELKRKFPEGGKGSAEPDKPGSGVTVKGTNYGEAALLMLQSVAELGYFTAADFGPRFIAYFSAEDYRGAMDDATRGTLDQYHAYTGNRPGSSYHFQGGANDDSAAALTRLAPVIVNRCLQESLLKVVESATRVSQNNERAIAYAKCHALISQEILTGKRLLDAVKRVGTMVGRDGDYGKEISSILQEIPAMLEMDVREVTKKVGQGSNVKSSFPAALHCALKYEDDLSRAVTETANAGGDCAARAAMIGTWLGAQHGMQGIPAQWRDKVKAKSEVEICVEKIVAKLGK